MPPGSPGSRISRYCKVVHQHHHDSEHGESNSNFVFIAFHYHGYNEEQLIGPLCGLEVPTLIQLSLDRQKLLYSTGLTWGHQKGKFAVSTLWLASTGTANSSIQLTPGRFRDHAPLEPGTRWALYFLPLQQGAEAYPITPVENERHVIDVCWSLHWLLRLPIARHRRASFHWDDCLGC